MLKATHSGVNNGDMVTNTVFWILDCSRRPRKQNAVVGNGGVVKLG